MPIEEQGDIQKPNDLSVLTIQLHHMQEKQVSANRIKTEIFLRLFNLILSQVGLKLNTVMPRENKTNGKKGSNGLFCILISIRGKHLQITTADVWDHLQIYVTVVLNEYEFVYIHVYSWQL